LYLFGAAPAVCSSFLAARPHNLDPFQANHPNGTLYKPYATSLRMGRLGYQSAAQAQLKVSYNSLEEYASALRAAMTTPYPAYEAVGVKNPGGEYNQLSTSLLQLENEFYGMIRPKRTTRSGERPVPALLDRGVEYVEVRCMDLDPFEPVGINANTMRFIDMLLLHCLTTDSPLDTPEAIVDMGDNVDKVTSRGREPGLQLTRLGKPVVLTDWLAEILQQMRPIAQRLDAQFGEQRYAQALALAFDGLADPSSLPSARVIEAMQQSESKSYVAFIRQQSALALDQLKALPWSEEQADSFAEIADKSLDDQKAIEAADNISFDDYIAKLLDL
jgi:glutamate--cysteine ligase